MLEDPEATVEAPLPADRCDGDRGTRVKARLGENLCHDRYPVGEIGGIVHHSELGRVPRGEQGRMAGASHRRRANRGFEHDTVSGQPVYVRSCSAVASVGAEEVRPQRVDDDQHYVDRVGGHPIDAAPHH